MNNANIIAYNIIRKTDLLLNLILYGFVHLLFVFLFFVKIYKKIMIFSQKLLKNGIFLKILKKHVDNKLEKVYVLVVATKFVTKNVKN